MASSRSIQGLNASFSTLCIRQQTRSFHSTPVAAASLKSLPPGFRNYNKPPKPPRTSLPMLRPKENEVLPDYPYGPTKLYRQSRLGLYGGARIQFGHNVSKRTETKTLRTFKPNVQRKKLWSRALGRWLKLRVTTRVLRTIDKVGGLDEYLLGDKPMRIKDLGEGGWLLRWRLLQTPSVKKRYQEERKTYGLIQKRPSAKRTATTEVAEGKGFDGKAAREMSREEVDEKVREIDEEIEREYRAGSAEEAKVEVPVAEVKVKQKVV